MVEVQDFIKKHYKGGTVIDYGCGAGRYAKCFPKEMYLGVDGDETNIKNNPYKAELHDLETWKPDKQYDYLLSSVVFDQVSKLPIGWAKKYILIEDKKYRDSFRVIVDEPLIDNVRMMIVEDK